MWIFVCLSLLIRVIGANNLNDSSLLEQLLAMMKAKGHDYRLPPVVNKTAIPVDLGVYVNAIGDIDEINMDFSVNIYLRHSWLDLRLDLPANNDTEGITLPDHVINEVWRPDTFIENGKGGYKHYITKENHALRVYPGGRLFYSARLSLKMWCLLHLEKFPLDVQTCRIQLMSYHYTENELKLRWVKNHPIENYEKIKLARFLLVNVTRGDCTQPFVTGTYSCAYVEFQFKRQFGYYLIQIYVPSSLIVLLSWVSFWLDPLAVPGRISLGVLTILTMTTQMASASTSSLPKVSYVKAIDVWLTTCMVFVFAALLEFAVVNSLARKEISQANKYVPAEDEPRLKVFVQKVMLLRQQNRAVNGDAPTASVGVQATESANEEESYCRRLRFTSTTVDVSARVLFPLLFATVNALYWPMYVGQ